MKQHKWDIIISILYYCLPLWLMLITLFIKDGLSNEIFILAVVSMVAIWRIGMNIMRINNLESEVENLKKKLNELE